jgi:hypothetical protein
MAKADQREKHLCAGDNIKSAWNGVPIKSDGY